MLFLEFLMAGLAFFLSCWTSNTGISGETFSVPPQTYCIPNSGDRDWDWVSWTLPMILMLNSSFQSVDLDYELPIDIDFSFLQTQPLRWEFCSTSYIMKLLLTPHPVHSLFLFQDSLFCSSLRGFLCLGKVG
jgi:hypothetical protein